MYLRYWAKQLAEDGLIGIVLSQSPEYVTPHGATEAIFGTNPFAIGVPTQQGSVVVDMATSATSWFGLVEADRAGEKVAADIGYDAAGQSTTDPAAIYKGGSIRVFDRSFLLSLTTCGHACTAICCQYVGMSLPCMILSKPETCLLSFRETALISWRTFSTSAGTLYIP